MNSLLNSQVLVLNRLWQAVNICTARRAFALVYAGHAHVVSSDETNDFLTHDFESWRDVSATAPDGEVMAVRHRSLRVDGVQFHPESVLTPEGPAIARNFLERT